MYTGSILSHPGPEAIPLPKAMQPLHLPPSRESVCSNQCVCLQASHGRQATFTLRQTNANYIANGRDEVTDDPCASKNWSPMPTFGAFKSLAGQLTCWLLLIQTIPSCVLVSSGYSQSKPHCCSSRLLKCSPASVEEINQSWQFKQEDLKSCTSYAEVAAFGPWSHERSIRAKDAMKGKSAEAKNGIG